jgi:hypothetical protein
MRVIIRPDQDVSARARRERANCCSGCFVRSDVRSQPAQGTHGRLCCALLLCVCQDVAKWIASYIKARINAFKPTTERPFVLGLVSALQ